MTKFVLHNSMTNQKESFIPFLDEGKKDFVGIYSCGPTVYSEPHIGNLRSVFLADILRHTLRDLLEYPVKHVMNITDVGHLVSDGDSGEDKLEKGSRLEGLSAYDVARKYEEMFRAYMQDMNVEFFDVMPRATEHIPEQIDLVQKLEAKGYTYTIEDGVYMDTSKVSDYGKLLGPNYEKHIQGLLAGARIDVKGKKNPTDFALWKFSPTNEKRQMEWESPWGIGFPGWHIECSAMASRYLGEQFDIHTGGHDLISVHHTNEIVQSECGFGVSPWVKYWMHNQFVTTNGEKASKSKGNFIALSETFEKGYTLLDFRYMFLNYHYRNFIDFTYENLEAARTSRKNLRTKAYALLQALPESAQEQLQSLYNQHLSTTQFSTTLSAAGLATFQEGIKEASDDLNTPRLLALLQSLLNKKDNPEEALAIVFFFDEKLLKLNIFADVFASLASRKSIPDEVQKLAQERWEAKQAKQYREADVLREKIEALGFSLLDTKEDYSIIKSLK